MKKTLLIAIAVIMAANVFSQQPTFDWAKRIGNSYGATGTSIATDAAGNVYTIGFYSGKVDFDPGPGTYYLAPSGPVGYHNDIYISKLDSAGNFVWARSFGGLNDDRGLSIAVDGAGNVFATGIFLYDTIDFDPGPGVYNLSSASSQSAFVLKLDTSGNFIWASEIVGGASGNAITLDAADNVYITGYFIGTADFDPGINQYNLTSTGNSQSIFVSKLDSGGNLVWAQNIREISGSGLAESGRAITVDAAGNVYVTGSFRGTVDFNPDNIGIDTLTAPSTGVDNIFILKLNRSGSFVWAKNIDGNMTYSGGYGIAVDGAGNVYSTGVFRGTSNFGTAINPYNITAYNKDMFVLKLNSSGNFIWANNYGGGGENEGQAVALDALGYVYIGGWFGGWNYFNPNCGGCTVFVHGDAAYVLKLDTSGNYKNLSLMSSADTGDAFANAMTLDASDNIYMTGFFHDTVNFNPGSGIFNLMDDSMPFGDAFVLKLNQSYATVGINQLVMYNEEMITIAPNPFTSQTTISFSEAQKNTTIKIMDVVGKEIKTVLFSGKSLILEKGEMQSGVYFVQITVDSASSPTYKNVVNKKVVVE